MLAARESAELLAEDRYLGGALARVLVGLGIAEARPWCGSKRASFATLFALAAERWGIPLSEAAEAYVWVWCENQVAAATAPVGAAGPRGSVDLASFARIVHPWRMACGGGRKIVVWRLGDGRAGHESQSQGLIEALGRLVPVEVHELAAQSVRFPLGAWLRGRVPAADRLPDPELLVGAGHATHLPLLAARRARGGRIVLLMRPSLPVRLFDLCLVPEHDRRYRSDNVIRTQGVLNRIAPSTEHRADEGLILLGGPSRHKFWTEARLLDQIRQIVAGDEVRWEIADSRRTPATTSQALAGLNGARYCPHRETPPDWLPAALARAGSAWVTEDSVSMVYEALTSGAAVGLLRLPRRRHTRVNRGIAALVARGWVTPFERWSAGAPLQPPPAPLREAARCAALMVERFGLGPCRSR